MDDIQQNKSLKARLHRRFLSQQLGAIFVAAKLHQVSNMFETPAISRRQIWKSHLAYTWDFEVATLARQKLHLVAAKKIAQVLASLKNDKRNRNSFLAWSVPRAVDLCFDSVLWIHFDLHMLKYAFLKKNRSTAKKTVAHNTPSSPKWPPLYTTAPSFVCPQSDRRPLWSRRGLTVIYFTSWHREWLL